MRIGTGSCSSDDVQIKIEVAPVFRGCAFDPEVRRAFIIYLLSHTERLAVERVKDLKLRSSLQQSCDIYKKRFCRDLQ